jgi:hypothetical protein
MTEQWLWGDGQDLLWGDGEFMGEDGGFSLLSTGTTWNPADKSAHVVLSNGDLTAKSADADAAPNYRWARSTTSKTTGKVYFEATCDAMSFSDQQASIGTAIAASDLEDYLGQQTDSSAYYGNGDVYDGNAIAVSLAAYTAGDTVGCAIDLDAGKGWYCDKNGTFGAGDPGAGTGAHFTFTPGTAIFAGFTLYHVLTDQITVNFGATAFVHTEPTGFSAWDAAPVVAAATPTLTYGAAPHTLAKRRSYEAQVRAHWERIEEAERQEQARRERVAELQRQQAEVDAKAARRKQVAQASAVARRRAKLAREIDALQAEQERAAAEVAEARALIAALEAELMQMISDAQALVDRRRRMMLVLATAA